MLNELLTLPTAPKVLGNPRDPSNVSYTPYTPNHVKTQVLITLTTILVTSEAIYRQPSTIESLVDILFEIIMHVNDSHDRLLRQTAAETLRELSTHFSGLLIGRLGLLFRLAREERLHVKLSYTSLFATALISSLQCLNEIANTTIASAKTSMDPVLGHFVSTLQSLGLHSATSTAIRILDTNPQETELPSFQIQEAPGIGKSFNFEIGTPKPLHWVHLMRPDLEAAATFILEQLPSATIFEASRLSQLLTSLLQMGYISKFALDDANDGHIPGLSNEFKSLTVSTELLVRPERLSGVLRWALQTNQTLLWSAAQTILSRVPIGLIQPQFSRGSDGDALSSSQLLTHMLRDNVLALSRQSIVALPPIVRAILLEWISRRPIHAGADSCAYLITTPHTHIGAKGERVASLFDGRIRAGSSDLPLAMAHKLTSLFPGPFDSLPVVLAKFTSLTYCYASSGHERRIPRSFLRAMSVFADFPTNAESAKSQFQVITHLLLNFPSLFDPIMQYLECVMVEHAGFSEVVWEVFEVLGAHNKELSGRAILRLCRFLATVAPPLLFDYLPLLLKLVCIPFAKVGVLLEALRLNLRVSPRTPSGEWSFGNTILEVVHLVLLHHNVRDILSPACDVLSVVRNSFGDFEIRDRANFYLQLLTHVPADKIKAVIEVTKETMAENLDVDNPFINTEQSKLNSAGFQPITFKSSSSGSGGSGLDGPVSAPNILQLTTTCNDFNLNSLAAMEHASNGDSSEKKELGDEVDVQIVAPLLDAYYSKLLALQWGTDSSKDEDFSSQMTSTEETYQAHQIDTSSPSKIHLPFLLRFKRPSEIGEWRSRDNVDGDAADSGLPLSLYSISLKLTGSPLYASHNTTVSIPFLSADLEPAQEKPSGVVAPRYGTVSHLLDNDGGSSFPHSFSFVLDVNVLLPLPTTLQVKATANTDEGAVAEISLDPIHISLRQIFLPLPSRFVGDHNYDQFATALFGEMWARMDEKTKNSKISDSSTDSDRIERVRAGSASSIEQNAITSAGNDEEDDLSFGYVASVKYISKPAKHVKEAIKTNLAPFLVGKVPIEECNGQNTPVRAFIFLPHHYHLLLSFEILEEHTIIRIRTDWWRILTHVDRYFEDILKVKSE